ncbi:hypothetical protein [Nocardioides sp.]|uniref:hypothetical protein n=1 Tax=Nocardioides sp. TaxID=35761 RepID=UPI002B27224E|nr:hypothetical protein [Nocardioides sp.]
MNLLSDITTSLLRAPAGVLVWMSLGLLPANVASLFFLDQPYGVLVAVLAIGGLLPNLVIMARYRGFTSVMGVPHTLAWIPLVVLALVVLLSADVSTSYAVFLVVLVAVDGISLCFDVPDTLRWRRGEQTTY